MQRIARRLAAYAAAALLVRTADEGARIALTFLALERRHSAALGGLLVAAVLVPHVVAAPGVGILTDRSARPHRVVALGAAGFGGTLIAAALLLGRIPDPTVVTLLVLGGGCGPALTGALTSQLARLVPADRLPRAFGMDALTYNAAGICGPAAAAVLSGAASAQVATVMLGGAAILGALVIAALPMPPSTPTAPGRTDRGGPADLTAGVRVLFREPVLAAVTAASSVAQVGVGALPIIVVLAATRAHRPGDAGWVLAAAAFGGLMGSAWWTARPARSERAPSVVMAGLVIAGAAVLCAAGHPTTPVLAGLLAVSGVASGPLFGAVLVTRHDHAPAELRAQVFALSAGIKITATAVGAALAGAVTSTTSLKLIAAGALPILAGLLGALALLWLGRRPTRPGPTASADSQAAPVPSG